MHILFVSRWFPYPPDNGSRIRVFNLIKHLSARNKVDLISFTSEVITDNQMTAMQHYCQRVEVAPYEEFQPHRLKALLGYLSRRPRSVVDTYSAEMQRLVERVGRESSYKVVIASQMAMAPYVLTLRSQPKVLEEVELTVPYDRFTQQRRLARKLRSALSWWKLSHYAAGLLRAFAGCTVVSELERERVLQVLPGYPLIGIVPNGVDVAHHTADFGPPIADTLVYSGALTYQANFDAIEFFLREVFPLIQSQRPNVKLFITGRLDGVPLDQLPRHAGVTFTGYLDDIRPAVARCWASIVPLRVGGGTRLKVLESLALGTPVIATRKGAEGLDLAPGRDILIADEPAEFATAVVRVLQDAEWRESLSRNGRRAVTKYDWQTVGQQFASFVETVVSQTRQTSARS